MEEERRREGVRVRIYGIDGVNDTVLDGLSQVAGRAFDRDFFPARPRTPEKIGARASASVSEFGSGACGFVPSVIEVRRSPAQSPFLGSRWRCASSDAVGERDRLCSGGGSSRLRRDLGCRRKFVVTGAAARRVARFLCLVNPTRGRLLSKIYFHSIACPWSGGRAAASDSFSSRDPPSGDAVAVMPYSSLFNSFFTFVRADVDFLDLLW